MRAPPVHHAFVDTRVHRFLRVERVVRRSVRLPGRLRDNGFHLGAGIRGTEPASAFRPLGLEGELSYRHGSKLFSMAAGDSLLFEADVPHGPEQLSKTPVRCLAVVCHPRSPDR
jgi:Cupin domain